MQFHRLVIEGDIIKLQINPKDNTALENTNFDLQALPSELLAQIFAYQDIYTLLSLAKICKHFTNIVIDIIGREFNSADKFIKTLIGLNGWFAFDFVDYLRQSAYFKDLQTKVLTAPLSLQAAEVICFALVAEDFYQFNFPAMSMTKAQWFENAEKSYTSKKFISLALLEERVQTLKKITFGRNGINYQYKDYYRLLDQLGFLKNLRIMRTVLEENAGSWPVYTASARYLIASRDNEVYLNLAGADLRKCFPADVVDTDVLTHKNFFVGVNFNEAIFPDTAKGLRFFSQFMFIDAKTFRRELDYFRKQMRALKPSVRVNLVRNLLIEIDDNLKDIRKIYASWLGPFREIEEEIITTLETHPLFFSSNSQRLFGSVGFRAEIEAIKNTVKPMYQPLLASQITKAMVHNKK
jgi:hypothetical protein